MTMRTRANVSLALLAVLFFPALYLVKHYSSEWWLSLLLYTIEAGLIGALADWFAVTVLFRHPLGMKWVPHTAIIPRNRTKLIDGIVMMVEGQLLGKQMLLDKVRQLNIVQTLIRWGDQEQTRKQWSEKLWQLLLSVSSKHKTSELASKLDTAARSKIKEQDLSFMIGKLMRYLLEKQYMDSILNQLLSVVSKQLQTEETKVRIYELLQAEKEKFSNSGGGAMRWLKQKLIQFAESSDAVNLEEAANTLYRDLHAFLHELQSPEHELRQYIYKTLYDLSSQLEDDIDVRAAVEEWKNELLEQISLQPSFEAMLSAVYYLLHQDTEALMRPLHKEADSERHTISKNELQRWLQWLITTFWRGFRSDKELQQQLETYIQQLIVKLIEAEHEQIGLIVRRTLDDFSEERLVEFIESKVDTDLQRIRLNGALIGAAAGAIIYCFLYGIYSPLLEWAAG